MIQPFWWQNKEFQYNHSILCLVINESYLFIFTSTNRKYANEDVPRDTEQLLFFFQLAITIYV